MFGRSETRGASPLVLEPGLRRDGPLFASRPQDDAARLMHSARQLVTRQRRLDPDTYPPDPDLDMLLAPEMCLEYRILPWGRIGDAILVATVPGRDRTRLRDILEQSLGPVLFAEVSEEDLVRIVTDRHGEYLADRAERLVPDDYSCRDINKLTLSRGIVASLFFGVSLALIYVFPNAFFAGITAVAVVNLIATVMFKVVVLVAGYRKPPDRPVDLPLSEKPVVSLIVPLFREAAIANELVMRLSRLSYPKALLDVVLVLEEKDRETRQMIDEVSLPGWMRVVRVPDGQLKTNPAPSTTPWGIRAVTSSACWMQRMRQPPTRSNGWWRRFIMPHRTSPVCRAFLISTTPSPTRSRDASPSNTRSGSGSCWLVQRVLVCQSRLGAQPST